MQLLLPVSIEVRGVSTAELLYAMACSIYYIGLNQKEVKSEVTKSPPTFAPHGAAYVKAMAGHIHGLVYRTHCG